MAITLLETYETLMHSEFLRTTARQLGESESAVTTAISSGGAAIFARLLQLTGNAEAMTRIAALLSNREDDGPGRREAGAIQASTGAPVSAATRLGRGTALLNIAYGSRLQTLVDALAGYCGISQASARAAIGHTAPLVLKALGERLEEDQSSRAGLVPTGAHLSQMLFLERETIQRGMPAGLAASLSRPATVRVQPVAPAPTTIPVPPPAPTPTPAAAPSVRPREAVAPAAGTLGPIVSAPMASTGITTVAHSEIDGPGMSLPALLGGLAGLAFLWWLFLPGYYVPYSIRTTPSAETFGRPLDQRSDLRRADERGGVARPGERAPLTGPDTAAGGNFSSSVSSTPSSKTAPAVVTGLLRFIKRTLPSNKQIDFAEDGIEGRMIQLIENRSLPLDRNQWFDFDRLHFHTGSSNLTTESRAQVQNIADILASYPSVRIKIGGYTDNVGDSAANQRLSEARAQRVMTELIGLGVNALRLEAEGYGEMHAIGDNATADGRARNRRIAVRVIER